MPGEADRQRAFYQSMLPYAQAWAAQTGMPASMYLAFMAHESNYGNASSLFGMKGTGDAGSQDYDTHEVYNGQSVNINDKFASYSSPQAAFDAFIKLVSTAPRYKDAYAKLQTGDWQGFMQGINQAGYATDPNWASKVISLSQSVPAVAGTEVDTPQLADGGQIAAGEGVEAEREGPLVAGDAVARGIIDEIKTGSKKTREQIAQELYGKPFPELGFQENSAVEAAYSEQQNTSTYSLKDIQDMVAGKNDRVRLTPEQAVEIFRAAFNDQGQYTAGVAADIENKLLATKPDPADLPAGLTDSDLVGLYKETGNPEYLNRLREKHGPDSDDPWDEERINLWVSEAEEARAKFMESEEPDPIRSAFDPFGSDAPLANQIQESATFTPTGERVTSEGTLVPEDVAQMVLEGTAPDAFPGLGQTSLNATLGVSSPIGPIDPADYGKELSTFTDGEQFRRVFERYVSEGASPEEATYRARIQIELTNRIEEIMGVGGQPMDNLLRSAAPELYEGPAASGNARQVLPGGEERALYGGGLGYVDTGSGARLSESLMDNGYQGTVELLDQVGSGTSNLQEADRQALGQMQLYAQQNAGEVGHLDYNQWAQQAGFDIQFNRETGLYEMIDINGNVIRSFATQAMAQRDFGLTAYKYQQTQRELRRELANRTPTRVTQSHEPRESTPSQPRAPRPTPEPEPQPPTPPAPTPNPGTPPVIATHNFLPVYGFNEGGSFVTPEEIMGVGARTGRTYFIAGEGEDGFGGSPKPEVISFGGGMNPRKRQILAAMGA